MLSAGFRHIRLRWPPLAGSFFIWDVGDINWVVGSEIP